MDQTLKAVKYDLKTCALPYILECPETVTRFIQRPEGPPPREGLMVWPRPVSGQSIAFAGVSAETVSENESEYEEALALSVIKREVGKGSERSVSWNVV